jgi:hypothetical protein
MAFENIECFFPFGMQLVPGGEGGRGGGGRGGSGLRPTSEVPGSPKQLHRKPSGMPNCTASDLVRRIVGTSLVARVRNSLPTLRFPAPVF